MMTYGEFKETEMYLNEEESAICLNDEDILYDEMHYTEELLQINLLCSNCEDRNEPDFVAEKI